MPQTTMSGRNLSYHQYPWLKGVGHRFIYKEISLTFTGSWSIDTVLEKFKVARNSGYAKKLSVGKRWRNWWKICSHKESVPSSVPTFKVKTMSSGHGHHTSIIIVVVRVHEKKDVFTLLPIMICAWADHDWGPSLNAAKVCFNLLQTPTVISSILP